MRLSASIRQQFGDRYRKTIGSPNAENGDKGIDLLVNIEALVSNKVLKRHPVDRTQQFDDESSNCQQDCAFHK